MSASSASAEKTERLLNLILALKSTRRPIPKDQLLGRWYLMLQAAADDTKTTIAGNGEYTTNGQWSGSFDTIAAPISLSGSWCLDAALGIGMSYASQHAVGQLNPSADAMVASGDARGTTIVAGLRSGKLAYFAAGGAFLGIAALTRPVGQAVLVALPFAVLFAFRRWRPTIAACALGIGSTGRGLFWWRSLVSPRCASAASMRSSRWPPSSCSVRICLAQARASLV